MARDDLRPNLIPAIAPPAVLIRDTTQAGRNASEQDLGKQGERYGLDQQHDRNQCPLLPFQSAERPSLHLPGARAKTRPLGRRLGETGGDQPLPKTSLEARKDVTGLRSSASECWTRPRRLKQTLRWPGFCQAPLRPVSRAETTSTVQPATTSACGTTVSTGTSIAPRRAAMPSWARRGSRFAGSRRRHGPPASHKQRFTEPNAIGIVHVHQLDRGAPFRSQSDDLCLGCCKVLEPGMAAGVV